ncbi:hypothetical protein TeGR_g6408, partial [Tetraparma gracilis]
MLVSSCAGAPTLAPPSGALAPCLRTSCLEAAACEGGLAFVPRASFGADLSEDEAAAPAVFSLSSGDDADDVPQPPSEKPRPRRPAEAEKPRPRRPNVDDAVFSCTCPGWKFQGKGGGALRTCKHVRGLLGEAADALRMGAPAPPFAAAKPKKRKAKQAPAGDASIEGLVSLAEPYKPEKHAVAGHVVAEKLDGMRCIVRG